MWLPVVEPMPGSELESEEINGTELLLDALRRFGPVVLAVAVPMLTVLGFNLLGDGVRDILDPRMRS